MCFVNVVVGRPWVVTGEARHSRTDLCEGTYIYFAAAALLPPWLATWSVSPVEKVIRLVESRPLPNPSKFVIDSSNFEQTTSDLSSSVKLS